MRPAADTSAGTPGADGPGRPSPGLRRKCSRRLREHPAFVQNIHIAAAGAEYELQIVLGVAVEHRLVEGDGGEGIHRFGARCHHFKQIAPKGSRFLLSFISGNAPELRGSDGELAADSGASTSLDFSPLLR